MHRSVRLSPGGNSSGENSPPVIRCPNTRAKPNGRNGGEPGEENFTWPLHLGLHDLLHPCSAVNLRKRKGMTPKTATRKDAAQTSEEAGATPPFDVPCVTVATGALPPQSRAARDPFGRVPEPEFRSCKTTSITPRKDEDQSLRNTTQDGNLPRFMMSRASKASWTGMPNSVMILVFLTVILGS